MKLESERVVSCEERSRETCLFCFLRRYSGKGTLVEFCCERSRNGPITEISHVLLQNSRFSLSDSCGKATHSPLRCTLRLIASRDTIM